jgi:hypothetical protein
VCARVWGRLQCDKCKLITKIARTRTRAVEGEGGRNRKTEIDGERGRKRHRDTERCVTKSTHCIDLRAECDFVAAMTTILTLARTCLLLQLLLRPQSLGNEQALQQPVDIHPEQLILE